MLLGLSIRFFISFFIKDLGELFSANCPQKDKKFDSLNSASSNAPKGANQRAKHAIKDRLKAVA